MSIEDYLIPFMPGRPSLPVEQGLWLFQDGHKPQKLNTRVCMLVAIIIAFLIVSRTFGLKKTVIHQYIVFTLQITFYPCLISALSHSED